MMRCNDEAQSVILVSGATGFMGSAIARHLMAGGMSVRAMGRSAKKTERVLTGFPEGRAAAAEGRLSFVAADVTQPETLTSAVEGVDCIIQAAQFPGAPVENPARGLTYANVDRNGTINLLNAVESVFAAETGGTAGKRYPADAPRFFYLSGVTVSETAPGVGTGPNGRLKRPSEEAGCPGRSYAQAGLTGPETAA